MRASVTFESFLTRLRRLIISSTAPALGTAEEGLAHADPLAASEPAPAFEALALQLFPLQFAHNSAHRVFCQARGVCPKTITRWDQIPAIPTAAFKELEFSCIPSSERTITFHSSGTTATARSRHFHDDKSLGIYELSLWHWFTVNVLRDEPRSLGGILLLAPPPVQAPNSSLVHMFQTINIRIRAQTSAFVCGVTGDDGLWQLDRQSAVDFLRTAEECGEPVLILGTAFTLVHLLDHLADCDMRFGLAPGSRVMETGGYKGRSRSLPREELHSTISTRLGVPATHIFCEYGMSELSSQAYDTPSA